MQQNRGRSGMDVTGDPFTALLEGTVHPQFVDHLIGECTGGTRPVACFPPLPEGLEPVAPPQPVVEGDVRRLVEDPGEEGARLRAGARTAGRGPSR
jgi:hypothetical protein